MPRARRCAHCGERATQAWDLRPCALRRSRRFDLCRDCDLALNAVLLEFLRVPDASALLARYIEREAA